MMEAVAGRPSAALAPWVERYVGYKMAGYRPGIHAGMPSPRLTFIISLDAPVDVVAMPDRRQSPRRLQVFVGGLHTGAAEIAHDGFQYGLSVDVTPLGARALFGLPGGELASHVLDLDELVGSAARSLPERLRALPTWAQRFALLDAELARAVVARPERRLEPPPEVSHAFGLILASGGACEIAQVAQEVGWSRRHLAERFRQEIGLSPKATARLVRFDRAAALLGVSAPGRSLADVAAAAGYADQAHFNREFRALAGRTPTQWLAEDLPSVHDPEPV